MAALPLVEPSTRQAVGVVWRDRDPEPALVRALVNAAREARGVLAAA
jgi:DNA-binding transcriptional LysR family regulator